MTQEFTTSDALPPELLRLIGEDVASGAYRSVDEAVHAILREHYGKRAGQSLVASRSEQQVEALFAQAAAGMAQTDPTGRFLRVNDHYCSILGRGREELMRMRMQELTHPDDLPKNAALFRRLLQTGETFEIEKRYQRPDGSTVWVRNVVSPIRDASGDLESVLAVSVDITDYRQVQEELRGSESLKAAILDASLDCIICIDESNRVVEWNLAAERTFGYPRGVAIGRDLSELIIPPEYRDRHRRGMARFLATGEVSVLNHPVELEALKADGTVFPVEMAILPTAVGGSRRFTAFLRDISGRKLAEARRIENDQRLRSTYEHAFTGIAEVGKDGRFLRVNEQLSRITGYSREELLDRAFEDITHPEDREAHLDRFRRQMAGELESYTLEKRYVRKDGQTVWVELFASRVDGADGKPLYGIRVAHDITERKRAEEHQRLLINELNHRVKNTLATVQSIAHQTLRNAPTQQDALAALTSRLLALSKAHDVLTRESWEAASLGQIVAEAMDPFLSGSGRRIRFTGPEVRLPPSTALGIAMALQELATNAVKYGSLSNESGEVEIGWSVDRSISPALLRLRWEESGGPRVQTPKRKGFGTRLIERSLAGDLHGEANIEFAPSGLVCTIIAPVTDQVSVAA